MSHPFRRAKRSRHPRLSPENLRDPSKLGGLIDAVVGSSDNYRRLTAKILDHQRRLQELASEDAWIEYLHVEEATTARMDVMLTAVARWAFNEGRRPRPRS